MYRAIERPRSRAWPHLPRLARSLWDLIWLPFWLGSTLPPISPVAWSSFQTGVNPGKHNIFDFLIPDTRSYQPKLSSVEIRNQTSGDPCPVTNGT